MRVAVLGISGSGKTTFATRLADATGMDQVELDLLNWRPEWVSRYEVDFDGLARDLDEALEAERWVVAGGYSKLRDRILMRADTVVWLALPKWQVMWQVFWRSFHRAITRQPMLNGNVETFARWRLAGHPIQIAWLHYRRKRKQVGDLLAHPRYSHLKVYRCENRRAVKQTLNVLTAAAVSQSTN